MMTTIASTDDHGIWVDVGGRVLPLSWRWLRDHARDDESFLASAQQRMVRPDVVAAAGAGDASIVDGELVVVWPGGPTATYSGMFLSSLDDPAEMYGAPTIAPEPWVGAELDRRLTSISSGEILARAGLVAALGGLFRDGVIVIQDVPIDVDATRGVLERFGYVRSTIFGDLWEFSSDESAGVGYDDTASTPLEITPHTDGTYSHDAPGLLALHCHTYEATGGENVFVDGHTLARRLDPGHLDLLRTIEIPGQYIGDGAHLVARRPALRYEHDRLVQVSYNHHDRAPFLLPEPTMTELFDALTEFDAIANDPAVQFELALRPGDMVIFDNWRVLHGRRSFVGARHIAGGYVNREDLESTLRLLDADRGVGWPGAQRAT
jgi:trimethyllysine dioxygenase